MNKHKIIALIPAAGCSSRLGRSKQLVSIGGETVIARAVRLSYASGAHRVVVVTGADPKGIEQALPTHGATAVVHNDAWHLGIGSSLAAGAKWIEANEPDVAGVLVILPDQVLVRESHYRDLIEAFITLGAGAEEVIATSYEDASNGVGAPALFGRSALPEFQKLPQGSGAKALFERSRNLKLVPHPAAQFDLDTPEDLARLTRLFVDPSSHREQPQWPH